MPVLIISDMLLAMIALWKVRESPTEIGMRGSSGAMPPASKNRVRLGAWVFCASIAAAQGAPVPMAAILPSSNRRAAAQIIISILL